MVPRAAPTLLGAVARRALGLNARRNCSSIAVHTPRDGSVIGEIPDASAADVDAAVDAGVACLGSSWSSPSSVAARCAVLETLGASLRANLEELAKLETLDCGKPLAESRIDIETCAALCEFYAEVAPAKLRDEPIDAARLEPPYGARVVAAPAGLVGAVSPWNYPLMQAVAKVAPALAAGCATVLKPSPLASLTCVRLGELAADAGAPAGALTVVTGGPPGGRAGRGAERLVTHPRLDLLSFTGSGRAGRQLLRASAEALRPTTLELGGKGAAIVFDDADVAAAVDWACVGIFACAGQVCSATSRLLVHESIHDDVVAALLAAAADIRTGDPLADGTTMGPLVSAGQRDRVLAALADARADGCDVLLGGGAADVDASLAGGYYVEPTVLAAPRESRAWRDEIFGPVLAVSTFSTEAEAIAAANESEYGLAHAVFSADGARAERVGAALDAGTVWLNCSQVLWPATPFGGWKRSGWGKEFGAEGIDEFVRRKTVTTAPPGFSTQSYAGAGG